MIVPHPNIMRNPADITQISEQNRNNTNFIHGQKLYERHSKPRNKIAHGHCVGYLLADDNFVVFAIFERTGEEGLTVDAVPVEEMERATKWGEAFKTFILNMLNRLDSEDE